MATLSNMPLLLVHEQPGLGQANRKAVPFAEIIASTPRHLIAGQLYAQIAAPLKGGIFRTRSLAMLLEVLAAVVVHGRTFFSRVRGRRGSLTSPAGRRASLSSSAPTPGGNRRRGSIGGALSAGAAPVRRGLHTLFDSNHESLERDENVWKQYGMGPAEDDHLHPFMERPPSRPRSAMRTASMKRIAINRSSTTRDLTNATPNEKGVRQRRRFSIPANARLSVASP